MKTIYIFVCCLFMNTVMYAQYISSTVEQVSASMLAQGSINNPIIRIRIDVGATPIDLYALFLNTAGSTNPSTNIDTTRVFYTGNSTVFSTTTPYPGGTFMLSSGIHYFWYAYDISSTAIICDTIDGSCYTVYVSSGTQTPSVTNPIGFGIVGNCTTGIHPNELFSSGIKIYPNPFLSQTIITTNTEFNNVDLLIFDMLGQEVKRVKNISGKSVTLFRDNLPGGLYFIRLTEDNKVIAASKLVITD